MISEAGKRGLVGVVPSRAEPRHDRYRLVLGVGLS